MTSNYVCDVRYFFKIIDHIIITRKVLNYDSLSQKSSSSRSTVQCVRASCVRLFLIDENRIVFTRWPTFI